MDINLRKPIINELPELSSLALRSKAYWGYDNEFIEVCREELSVRHEFLKKHEIFIAEIDNAIAGFYVLEEINARKTELTFLFIEPKFIKNGIGKRLFVHAVEIANLRKYESIIIQSDPFAEEFYLKMGSFKIGLKPSASIANRNLPLLEYRLKASKSKVGIDKIFK